VGVRGFEWAVYHDDDGNRWLLQVDADYFADADRGWSSPGAGDTLIWPQGWRPREVEGVEDGGRLQRTRVGSTSAPLWTGAATSFVINASDESVVACAVFRYWGERRRPAPPPIP
jgi:hypothetical protein